MSIELYRYWNAGNTVYLDSDPVIRETPKGFWIKDPDDHNWVGREQKERWVSNYTKKRFAYPTKEEAWLSFIRRKERQRKILLGQLQNIVSILEVAHPENLPTEHTRFPAQSFNHTSGCFLDFSEPVTFTP